MGKINKKILSKGWFKRFYSKFKLPLFITADILLVAAVFVVGLELGKGNLSFSNSGVTGLPSKLDYSSVNTVYQALKSNYNGKLTETQILNGIKQGLASSANDPYTEYFTPQESKEFNNELNNSFSGIGAQLSQDSDGYVEIISPISGFPAAQAGLKPDDIITSINGKSTDGMSADEAAELIRGNAGTKVTLDVVRGSQDLTFTIVRKDITLPSVNYKIINGDIGYMQITTFANDTAALAQKAANEFSADHVKGIIFDLRDDPGGLVTAADSVSSLWLNQGQLILQEKRINGDVIETDYASGGNILHGIPTVVLINSGSASASEITAGALHDQKDAYLIGTKSFGKGVVQQLINFKDGSELKVTIASWYRPDGQNIEHKGITPDQVVNMNDNNINTSNDTQLQAAENYLATK